MKNLTITGRPVTTPTTFRLPVVARQQAEAKAKQEGISLSRLLGRWILGILEEQKMGRQPNDQ